MTTGGLTFSCCSLFVFLMANVVASRPTADDLAGPTSAERMMSRQASDDLDRHGPGYALGLCPPQPADGQDGSNLARQRSTTRRCASAAGNTALTRTNRFVDVDAEFLDCRRTRLCNCRNWTGPSIGFLGNLSEGDQAFIKKVRAYTTIAKLVAILSHLAIVLGSLRSVIGTSTVSRWGLAPPRSI